MNKFKCYIKNQTADNADLYFYGDIIDNDSDYRISRDDKCPMDVIKALDECKDAKNLNIYINSCGGDVFSGNAIYNVLKRNKAHKTVYIDGLAASIASVIALAGDRIVMPKNTYLMIHKAWTFACGNSNELRETADRLDEIEKSIVGVYTDNANEGIDEEEIKEKMSAETWLNADDASKLFKKIEVTDETSIAASISSEYKSKYKNIPKEVEKVEENTSQPSRDNACINIDIENMSNFVFTENEKCI